MGRGRVRTRFGHVAITDKMSINGTENFETMPIVVSCTDINTSSLQKSTESSVLLHGYCFLGQKMSGRDLVGKLSLQ